MSDPYKLLGITEGQIKGKVELEKARQRSKELYKRYASEKRDKEAKRVLEAFELIKNRFKKQEGSSGKTSNGSTAPASNGTAATAAKTSSSAAKTTSSAATPAKTSSASAATAKPGSSASTTAEKLQRDMQRDLAKLRGLGQPGGASASSQARNSTSTSHGASSQARKPDSAAKVRPVDAKGGSSTGIRQPGGVGLFSLGATKAGHGAGANGKAATKRPSTQDIPFDPKRVAVAAKPLLQNGVLQVPPEKLAARLVCKCTASYSAHRFQGAKGTFLCPSCRFRAMDPLNYVVKGSKGMLTLKLIQQPLIPEDAKTAASFKFKIDVAQIKEWRKKGDNVEARMCRLDSYEAHQSWPSSLSCKVNGKEAFEIKEPKAGHKRRDLPHRLSANLKPGVNSFEVSLKDENVQRYCLALVRTTPLGPKDMCKHVPCVGVEDSKQRVKDLLFSSMLEGCVEDFAASSASDRSRLVCPITLMRMRTPVRGKKCKHLQCYDLEAYLVANQKMAVINKRWHCPICDLIVKPPGDLFIDTFVVQILAETGELDEEVQFDTTAAWTVSAVAEPFSDSEAEAAAAASAVAPSSSPPAAAMSCGDDASSDVAEVAGDAEVLDSPGAAADNDADEAEAEAANGDGNDADDVGAANAGDNDVDDAADGDKDVDVALKTPEDEDVGLCSDQEAAPEEEDVALCSDQEVEADDRPIAPASGPPMSTPMGSPSMSPNWGGSGPDASGPDASGSPDLDASGSPDLDASGSPGAEAEEGEGAECQTDPYCLDSDPYTMQVEDDEVDEDFVATLNDSPTEGDQSTKSSNNNGHTLKRAMSMSMIATPAPLASPMFDQFEIASPGDGEASDPDDPLGVDKNGA